MKKYTSKEVHGHIIKKNGQKIKLSKDDLDSILGLDSIQAKITRAFRKEKIQKLNSIHK